MLKTQLNHASGKDISQADGYTIKKRNKGGEIPLLVAKADEIKEWQSMSYLSFWLN